jgi:drug/metabolite transporter (DMT)-like permease
VGLAAGLRPPGPRARDWALVAVAGLVGNTGFHALMVTGIHHTTAAHAAILVALSPVFAALLARMLLAEPLTRRRLGGIALAFAGVAVIVSPDLGAPGGGTWLGDALSLGASLTWAAYTVLGKPALAQAPARDVTTWATLLGSGPLLVMGWPGLATVSWAALSAGQWVLLLYLSAGTIALANLLWYWALARTPTARVVSFSYLIPLVSAVIAISLGQEPLSGSLVVGATGVIGGVALAQHG